MSNKIKKAVIPAAGAGSRLYPLTKVFRKEFLPVPGVDNKLIPAIEAIVREALSGGIEKVALLIQKEDEETFRTYFHGSLKGELAEKLNKPEIREYDKTLQEIGSHVDLITMTGYEGFGYAVSFAKDWAGSDKFLLLLGDHLYYSHTEETCSQQLLNIANRFNTNCIAITRFRESSLKRYGITKVNSVKNNKRLFLLDSIAEKPDIKFAAKNLRSPGLPGDIYYGIFGSYVLSPLVFEKLDYNIRNNIRERNEFQLTSVLEDMHREQPFYAYEVEGVRYDMGSPDEYIKTLTMMNNIYKNK